MNLRLALREGRLREDLYYRLCVIPIEVPPLRQRREDIPPLAQHLLDRATAQRGLIWRLSPQAMRLLLEYSWPGNVRELANVMEHAVAVARIETILPEDLPEEIRCSAPMSRSVITKPALHRETGVHAHKPLPPESERLIAALETHHWCRTETAETLGLSRSTLWR